MGTPYPKLPKVFPSEKTMMKLPNVFRKTSTVALLCLLLQSLIVDTNAVKKQCFLAGRRFQCLKTQDESSMTKCAGRYCPNYYCKECKPLLRETKYTSSGLIQKNLCNTCA